MMMNRKVTLSVRTSFLFKIRRDIHIRVCFCTKYVIFAMGSRERIAMMCDNLLYMMNIHMNVRMK